MSNSVDKNIRLSNTHKYVETLVFNVKLISCRTSEKFYKNITKIVKENGVSIIFLLNYILDEFIEIANLLEIYSPLLSEKQREYLEDHFENDLSISEIAKNNNVSRQAIFDNIKRGVALLYEYENKLKFHQIKQDIREKLIDLKEDFTEEKLENIIDDLV